MLTGNSVEVVCAVSVRELDRGPAVASVIEPEHLRFDTHARETSEWI
jgi:hypothetical protein